MSIFISRQIVKLNARLYSYITKAPVCNGEVLYQRPVLHRRVDDDRAHVERKVSDRQPELLALVVQEQLKLQPGLDAHLQAGMVFVQALDCEAPALDVAHGLEEVDRGTIVQILDGHGAEDVCLKQALTLLKPIKII